MSTYLLITPNSDELYHHGILGMKWGVRRFQPYRPGARVKGGKEVGKATKVKQRGGIVEHFKARKAAKKKADSIKKAQQTRKANADFEAEKKKAIESGSIEDLAKFKGKLTNEEYGRAFVRLQNEQKLNAMVAANQKSVWDTVDKGMDIVARLSKYAGTIANAKNNYDAMQGALHKKENEAKKEKATIEKNKFLTNIDNITELNEGIEKHKITPQEYQSAMNILANKKMNKMRFGTKDGDKFTEDQDFEDQNKKAAREQAEREQRNRTRQTAEESWKQYTKQQEKERKRREKEERKKPKDGTWREANKGISHSALDMSVDELYHHGIKGQKWGVRRFQDKNGRLTKAGKDRVKYLRDRIKASRGGIVDDTWKTGSAALTARTDSDIQQLTKRYFSNGEWHYSTASKVMRDFLRDTGDVPPDYKPNKAFTSFEEADLSYINPNWGQPGTTQNCAKCAVATELMKYGVAVTAGRQAFPSSADAMTYWFDGTEKVSKSLNDTEKLLSSYGDGASGTIAGFYPNGAGGHAMHFSVSNGEVHVQDGQNGRHFKSIREAAETYGFDMNRNMQSFRLDNATPNWDHMAEDSVIGAPRWQKDDDRWIAKPSAPFRFTNNSDGTIGNYDLTQESSNEIFRRHYNR